MYRELLHWAMFLVGVFLLGLVLLFEERFEFPKRAAFAAILGIAVVFLPLLLLVIPWGDPRRLFPQPEVAWALIVPLALIYVWFSD